MKAKLDSDWFCLKNHISTLFFSNGHNLLTNRLSNLNLNADFVNLYFISFSSALAIIVCAIRMHSDGYVLSPVKECQKSKNNARASHKLNLDYDNRMFLRTS